MFWWPKRRGRAGETGELLAAAGAVLDRSLDPELTTRAIVDMVVPRFADLCAVDLLREDGTIGETVAAADREQIVSRLHSLRLENGIDPNGEHPVARAIRTREMVVVQELTEPHALEQIAPEPETREFVMWSGYHSLIVAPLVAHGRLLGTLSFYFLHRGRGTRPSHLSLISDLADRAAIALDNANMYSASSHLARTLQRSLLPETLPVLDKLALFSAYHPVGEGNAVGGDFYDVFTTPFGCWLVVGDVCGKGPEAAAVTALVRHSIRAFAFVRPSPAQVLGAVNEVMIGHALAERFATVVVVRLDLSSMPVKAVIAGAGHPPPVLLGADGVTYCPTVRGMMLGVRSGSNVLDVKVELERGATIVLYTDGLLDAGAPQNGLTPRELCDSLTNHAGDTPQLVVEQLERLALSSGSGHLRDDVAIVVARVDG